MAKTPVQTDYKLKSYGKKTSQKLSTGPKVDFWRVFSLWLFYLKSVWAGVSTIVLRLFFSIFENICRMFLIKKDIFL